jgi:hypothetical protein
MNFQEMEYLGGVQEIALPLIGGYGIFFSEEELPDPGHVPQENPDILHRFFPGMRRISLIKAESDIEFDPPYKDTVPEKKYDYVPREEELFLMEIQASA